MTYALRVTYKSNKAPWSCSYEPERQLADDEAAIAWAITMAEGLRSGYLVTLTKGWRVLAALDTTK